MTSFLAGHLVDSAVSYYLLALNGWKDVGGLGPSPYINLAETDRIVMAKMGVVAAVIGMYALARSGETSSIKSKFTRATEVALKAGTAGVWAVQLWNAFNIIGEIALRGR